MRSVDVPDPAGGAVLLEVERFALTSNNITYGALGDSFGYWRFFPAPDDWGRIPAWGFASVIASTVPGVEEGLRVYGYLPMSTHAHLQLTPKGAGFVDVAAHRADLAAVYNRYAAAPAEPADNHRAVLQPLFITSFLLDDALSGGPGTVVLSSASSKTAMGLAWLLGRRGVEVIGLTSPGRVHSLARHGLYTDLVAYPGIDDLDIDALDLDGPVAFVDFAGDPAVVAAVHRRLGDRLDRSIIVGVTHWGAQAPTEPDLPGPARTPFFAPDRIRALSAGPDGRSLPQRMDAAMGEFVAANPWLRIVEHVGPDALREVYARVVDGLVSPEDAHVVLPRAR